MVPDKTTSDDELESKYNADYTINRLAKIICMADNPFDDESVPEYPLPDNYLPMGRMDIVEQRNDTMHGVPIVYAIYEAARGDYEEEYLMVNTPRIPEEILTAAINQASETNV